MRLPDAIAPYASLLKWLLIAVLLVTVFIGGCNHGVRKEAKKQADKIEQLDGWLAGCREQVNVLNSILRAIDADAEKQQLAAEGRAKDARAAATAAKKDAASYQKKLTQVEREVADAMKNPDCKRALEATSCVVLR